MHEKKKKHFCSSLDCKISSLLIDTNHLERLDVCALVNQEFLHSNHTFRGLKSTVVLDLKQVVNTLSNSDHPYSGFIFLE